MDEKYQEVFTPGQAAEYLQVSRDTVYRYIRDGKLVASKLGRTYRVPRHSLELFLWTNRTRDDVALSDYIGEESAVLSEQEPPNEAKNGYTNGVHGETEKNRMDLDDSSAPQEMTTVEFLLSTVGMLETEETDLAEKVEEYVAEILKRKYS